MTRVWKETTSKKYSKCNLMMNDLIDNDESREDGK